MLTPENEDEEFDFYVTFAKPLVLNLPDTNDRIKAATWVRYLKKDTTDPVQRGEYLKLLLFVLQRRRLFGPFATVPDENRPLEKFPVDINIQDVAKNFVEIDKKILKATLQRGGYGEWPPYNVACSSDLMEYSCSQEIPNFGIQCYFAVSQDPLQNWNHPEKALFPIGERMETLKPECPLIDTVSPDISCFVSGDQPALSPPGSPGSPRTTPRISPTKAQKDTHLDDVVPKSPKKSSPARQLDEFDMDTRVPPSWGSNLVNVKDSPSPTSPFLSPIRELDIEVSEQDMLDFMNDDIDLDEVDVVEAASYLQGDRLLSPERPQPTGPFSPARAAPPERPPPPLSPEVNIAPSGALSPVSPPSYAIPPMERVRPPSPMTPRRVKTPPTPCRAKTPCIGSKSSGSPVAPPGTPKTPPRSPVGKFEAAAVPFPQKIPQTPPSPKPILSPDQMFNALQYLASNKDMIDYFNESLPLPDDDPAFFLQGDTLLSPIHQFAERSDDEQRRQIEEELANMSSVVSDEELKKLEAEVSPLSYAIPPMERVRSPSPMTPRRVKTPPPCRTRTPCIGSKSSGSPVSPPGTPKTPPRSPVGKFEAAAVPFPQQIPQTPPSPKPILSPNQMFNALQYLASNKDMLDYFNESLSLPDDDPAFFLQGDTLLSPKHQIAERSDDEQRRQIEEELANMSDVIGDEELAKLEAEVFGTCRSPVYPQAQSLIEEENVCGKFADEERSPLKLPPPLPKPAKKPTSMNFFQKRMAELEKKQLGPPAPEVAPTMEQFWEEINPPSTSQERSPLKAPPPLPKPAKKRTTGMNYFQKRMEELEKKQLRTPPQEVAAQVQQFLEEINQPSTIPTEEEAQEYADRSGVGLGGDSFIAPDKQNYGWFGDLPPGPGLPQDEQQDPALWDSFGWWTEDPNEIFMYMSPSPRGKRVQPDDPYAADRERWAENAPHTPPIFSRDPRIREGPAAQRQYNIDEFGMLSFEEPNWTSGEKYLKYKTEFSPYTDPRDIDRKTLDPSQFPKYVSPTLKRRLSDIQGSQDEEQMFGAAPPDFADISFTEQDNRPMTRVEAKWEAIRHGPQYIGLPPTPKQKSPEANEGEWANTAFLEKTPPAFMLEPPFLATPPPYQPTQEIDVDNLEDSIGKYIDEDLKIINAKIPVTTPQRSSSPKRPKFLPESPPFVPEIDVEPDPYLPSPQKIPEKYVVPPKKMVAWNTNIGTPTKFKQSDTIIIESEEDLRDRNLRRKNELKMMYEQQFKSPDRIPTPPAMPHLMDSYVPRRLPAAMQATKLPPPGWSYQTPPNMRYKIPPVRKPREPTGFTPPRVIPRGVGMFNESPPAELYTSLLEDSPELSPYKTPEQIPQAEGYKAPDILDMAGYYDFEGLDDSPVNLYESPPGLKTPSPRQQAATEPAMTRAQLDAEIAALEAELELLKTPEQRPRSPDAEEFTPELDRRLWLESIKLHDPVRYKKDKKFYVAPAPAKGSVEVKQYNPPPLHTIMSPRHPKDPEQELRDRMAEKAFQANREVMGDITTMHKKKEPKHYKLKYYQQIAIQDSFFTQLRQIAYRRHKPKIDWPVSPPVSPEPQPHLLDEPVPEDMPRGLIRPSGWNYQTPPHLRYQIPPERQYKTPTGISPPREHKLPPKGTLFYESPPENFESPLISQEMNLDFSSSPLISQEMNLDFSSPEGLKLPPRLEPPDRVPTARDFRAPDVIDLAQMYPNDFEGLDEDMDYYKTPPRPGSPVGHSRPPRQPSPEMTDAELEAAIDALETEVQTPKERRPVPANDITPEMDRLLWKESIKLHEPVEYDRKRIWVCPGPARLRDTMQEVTGLQAPPFDAVLSPREMERREWLESIKSHTPVEYERKRIWVAPGPAKLKDTMREVTGLQAPPFDPIMSPRHPVDPEKKRQELIEQMKFQAGREVMRDMTELHKKKKEEPKHYKLKYYQQKAIQDSFFTQLRQIAYRRHKPKIDWPVSPPEMPPSPGPPQHILDEPVPEDLPRGMIRPSGWNWQTPPNMKFKMPHQRRYRTPTGISPPRPKGVAMFSESPPSGFDSSILDDSSELVYDRSATSTPRTPRQVQSPPPLSPPRRIVPAGPDVFDRAMMHPEDFQSLDAEPLELHETPPGFRIPTPTSPPRMPPSAIMPPAAMMPPTARMPPSAMMPPAARIPPSAMMHPAAMMPPTARMPPSAMMPPAARMPPSAMLLPAAMMPAAARMPPSAMMPHAGMMPPAAYQVPVLPQTRTPPRGPDIFDYAVIEPAGFEDLLDLSPVDLYESPTGPSPRQQVPTTPELTKEELDSEIAALEAELQLLKTPEQRPGSPGEDDMTPELDRQLWMQSVKMHDPVRYNQRKKFYVCDDPAVGLMEVVGWNPPPLHTIMSPRHPVDPEAARQEKVQAMGFAANREVMGEIQKQWKKRQEVDRDYSDQYYENMEQFESPIREHREREMRKFKPKIAWPASPPEIIPTQVPPPHMLDEPVPEGLPTGLIRPSGWSYQTPPNMRYKIPPVRKPREPTGFTPPRVIPRGVAMFNESPPAELYTSLLEDSPELSPYRTPEQIPQAEGYTAPDILDIAGYYPDDFEGFDDSPVNLYESPPGLKTPSPRQQAATEPAITRAQLDAEIAALEAELELLKTPEQRPRSPGSEEFTPELDRRLWLESIKLHDPVRYKQDKKFYVAPAPAKGSVEVKRYNPPPLHTVMSPRHPKDPEQELRDRMAERAFQANREVMGDITTMHKKKEPKHYKLLYYQQKAIQDSFFTQLRQIAYRRHKPKIDWPVSPPEMPPPPGPPLHILDEPVPEDLPRGIIRPCGWNYRTPPNLKYKIPPVRKYKTPSAVSPVRVKAPPPAGSLFYESPPLLADSPEYISSPPEYISSPQGISDSLAIFPGSPPPELYISTSPPTYQSGISGTSSPLYASPAWTPTYQQLSEESPILLQSPELEDYIPIPPPRPRTPIAYSPRPRRIPRKRHALDPNILYAHTPKSAEKSYQPRPEPLRFEHRRPMQFRPVSPEPPRDKYLQSPIATGNRPWRKRIPIDINLTRKRLVFDEDEKQYEHEMIQDLAAQLRAASPGAPPVRDVLNESLPEPDLDLAEISLLGDLEYEPEGFVLYQDPDAPQYNIRPAFEGQPNVDLMDTSPIRTVDQIPEDQRDFNWMGCGTKCPWS